LLRLVESADLDVIIEEMMLALKHCLRHALDKLLVVCSGPSIDLVPELLDRKLREKPNCARSEEATACCLVR
jgi:hypothetical protein